MPKFSGLSRLAAILIAAAAGAIPPAQAEPARITVDLLDRPARISARAERSVLLAVTRAGQRLVAVGEAGLVLLSDDNGASWRQAKVPTSVSLTNVRFASGGTGWAVGHGGVVLKTTDAGETWLRQLDGRQAAQIELDAARAQAGQGAAGSDRRVHEAERLLRDGPDKPFLDVHFSDTDHGLVVGAYGLIFATGDGGRTWQSLKHAVDNPKGRHLYGIHATGGALYVTGEQGALYRSSDGGRSFAEVKTPYVGTYFGALAAAGGELVVFGLRGNAYRTVDHGATWQKIELGAPVTVTAGSRLADGSLVLVDETGRVLASGDGGQSFRPLAVPRPSPFTGIVQAADRSLVLTGMRGLTRLEPKHVEQKK